MVSTFKLPRDGKIYTESIFSRCRELISYQFWSGLQRSRLDAWIANFKTAEERYFAARVLDALIYRSEAQTDALLRQLLSRVVPDQARIRKLSFKLQDIYTTLRDPVNDPRVRVVPVIPPGTPPTKSGAQIARNLKRHLRVSENWIIYPAEVMGLLSKVDAFVFVDDFLGSGDQFSDFLFATKLDACLPHSCFIYGCLAGHKKGIDALKTNAPGLHVAAVERLDDTHALFDDEGGFFPDDINSTECAQDFYYDLIKSREIDISGPDRRGYGHLEIVYAFEHAVPDNSLPILWWNQSPKWQPLFDR